MREDLPTDILQMPKKTFKMPPVLKGAMSPGTHKTNGLAGDYFVGEKEKAKTTNISDIL